MYATKDAPADRKIQRITPQSVVSALRSAGFASALRTSRGDRRNGYRVMKINAATIGVLFHDHEGLGADVSAESGKYLDVLNAAGFTAYRPEHGGPDAVLVRKYS